MKKPTTEELSRVRKLLAHPEHYSSGQLRIWRKSFTRLRRKVEAAFKLQRIKEEELHQLTLKLK